MQNNVAASGSKGFVKGLVIYGIVLLVLIGAGLAVLWGFLAAYEESRPHIAIDAYVEQLTTEHIVDSSMEILEAVDTHIQSEEACRERMLEALAGEFSYARMASECTDVTQVYMLRCGKQVIGSFAITASGEGAFGFTPWEISGEEFDLSFLINPEVISITVPEGYVISVNGVALDESYIVDTEEERYDILEDYYDQYSLPVIVRHTYEAGPFLNDEFVMEVTDRQGNPFVTDESYDVYAPIHNVAEEQQEKLDAFLAEFLDRYVEFAGCSNKSLNLNFHRLVGYIVPDSSLVTRLREAMDGMQYAQSRGDEITDIQVNHYVQLADGAYLCDATYKVETIGNEGKVETTTNVRIVILENEGKFLVDFMTGY